VSSCFNSRTLMKQNYCNRSTDASFLPGILRYRSEAWNEDSLIVENRGRLKIEN
jgi:hypothetical protein